MEGFFTSGGESVNVTDGFFASEEYFASKQRPSSSPRRGDGT